MVLGGVRLDGLVTSTPFHTGLTFSGRNSQVTAAQKQPGNGSLLRVPTGNDVEEGQHAASIMRPSSLCAL